MRRKKKPGERYSFRRAMGFGTQTVQNVLYGRPVLHVDTMPKNSSWTWAS